MKEYADIFNWMGIEDKIQDSVERQCAEKWFVIVTGHHDISFKWAINARAKWSKAYITKEWNLFKYCDDYYCPHSFTVLKDSHKIEAVFIKWSKYCFEYKTDIPHETFNVYNDWELYCNWIIFDKNALYNKKK